MGSLDDAAEIDVTPDVFDRGKGQIDMGRIMHHQDNAGDDLDDQHEGEDRAEGPPVIEVLRRGVIHQMFFGEPDDGKTVVEPALDSGARRVIASVIGHALYSP